MAMSESIRKLKIKSTVATVIAIILLAIYFIRDFTENQQIMVGIAYVVIILFGASLTAKKKCFKESIYILSMMFVISIFFKYSGIHFEDPEWFKIVFLKSINFSEIGVGSLKKILVTPYIYFYLISLLLWFFAVEMPSLSKNILYVLRTLGYYSLWAIVLHSCTIFFVNYELLGDIVFGVFFVGAFWAAYTTKNFQAEGVIKTSVLTLLMAIMGLFYTTEVFNLINTFHKLYNAKWYYLLGGLLISLICILSEELEEYVIGIAILGTGMLLLLEKDLKFSLGLVILLVFHAVAISMYQFVWNTFYSGCSDKDKPDYRIVYICCYIGAFLLSVFAEMHFIKELIVFVIGLLTLLVYYGKYMDIEGKMYGVVLVGAIPWILLEVVMSSLGKLNTSLFVVMVATVMFWCVCGVALSWKDSSNIKSIVFEKTNTKSIILVLSSAAYLLSVIMLFI